MHYLCFYVPHHLSQFVYSDLATLSHLKSRNTQNKIKPYSFTEACLSDSATYPLFACLAVAGTFIAGCTINAFANNKDIRISPAHKSHVLRDWGQGHTATLTEVVGTRPLVNAQRYTTLPYEGLGMDHKEWLKQNQSGKK